MAIWRPVKMMRQRAGHDDMEEDVLRREAQALGRAEVAAVDGRAPRGAVLRTVAKNAAMNVTKMTGGSMPGSMRMASGTQASGGMGRRVSSSGNV